MSKPLLEGGEGPIAPFQTILSATSKNEEAVRGSDERGPGREPATKPEKRYSCDDPNASLSQNWIMMGLLIPQGFIPGFTK